MNVIRSEEDLREIHYKAENNQGKTFYYYLTIAACTARKVL